MNRAAARALALVMAVALAVVFPVAARAQARRDSTAKRDTVRAARRDTVPAARRDTIPAARRDTIPAPRDTIRTRRDSTARDSTARDSTLADSLAARTRARGDTTHRELVTWAPPDSVMSALLEREGYQATKYQGDTVVFRAGQKTIDLVGTPSAVQRDETILVGDTIVYNDSTKIATARGDTVVLRDPSQGEDVRVGRFLEYDIARQFGKAYNVSTAVESGQKWIVHGGRTAFQRDTSGADQSAFYLRNGWLTSCTDTLPHYHFAAKEMKVVSKNVIVARPAILYIRDIPVLWLPFIFQDLRSGRRSGLIPPRFGFSDIVRNAPTYRRTIDNFGYYFALNDYIDAQVTMDWRSSAGATDADPGWIRYSGQMRYVWLDRFLDGQLAVARQSTSSGTTNLQLTWNHRQDFSLRSHLNMSLNYVSNTQLQRQTTFNPYAALATIRSSLKYDQQFGGATLSVGGSQVQYTGREQVDRDFPSINLSTQPLRVGEWLTWTPTVALQHQESLNNDQPGQFSFFYRPDSTKPGGVDSLGIKRNQANTSLSIQTPLKIVDFDWRNSLRYRDTKSDFPQSFVLTSPIDSSVHSSRVFASTFQSELDWDTGINLPSLFQGTWNVSPSVSFSNVDPGPLFVRNQFTGGQWVHQTKRPTFGLSSSPTFYALFPGIGPISRLRHAVQPQITFSYAPSAEPGNEYLRALNRSRQGYLGALAQNAVTLGLSTNIEAKLRNAATDTAQAGDASRTIKLLSLNFTPITYDIQRARKGHSGFTTDRLGITGRSDLLPGLDFGMDWSLFQGSVLSDTAVFKPFRESIRGTLSLNRQSGLVVGLAKLFGIDLRAKQGGGTGDDSSRVGSVSDRVTQQSTSVATQPLGGSIGSAIGGAFGSIPSGQGFNASLTFTSTRQRPPSGNPANLVVNDPAAQCAYLRQNPFFYDQCLQTKVNASTPDNPFGTNTSGAAFVSIPAQTNMQGSMSFNITPKWAAQWSTTYDFVAHQFASHIVSLQRELHDWNAIFAFTQSPNGNFAFNFFIALKAEPDLKFNYDRRNFRRGSLGGLGTGTTTGQQ